MARIIKFVGGSRDGTVYEGEAKEHLSFYNKDKDGNYHVESYRLVELMTPVKRGFIESSKYVLQTNDYRSKVAEQDDTRETPKPNGRSNHTK